MKHGRLAAVVVMAAIFTAGCSGTSTKPPLATQTTPPTNGAVAYDAARKVVVLVTPGPTQQAQFMQTWTWDGRVWTRQLPTRNPTMRSSALLAYDQSRHVTVLQGGLSRQSLTDTWEWDGTNWTLRTPAHSPDVAQQPGSLSYDSTGHRMLLYQWPKQTWGWDGSDWTQLKPAHIPSLWLGNLASDGKRVILVGGSADGDRTETWGWTGSDWSLLAVGHTPEQPPIVPTVFDVANGKVVLYGGGPGDDTWTWDGTSWIRQHPRHSPVKGWPPQLVYDGALREVVACAGPDERTITGIYAWNGSDWTAVGVGTAAPVAAGNGVVSASDAEATIRRTVTNTSPILLPHLPAGVDYALVTADANGFSLQAMNDDRTIQIRIGIVVPGSSNLGAANKTIAFRRASAYYQYIANDPTGWRDIWWSERPSHAATDFGLKDGGVPYDLGATGLTEAEFFALASSLS